MREMERICERTKGKRVKERKKEGREIEKSAKSGQLLEGEHDEE